MNGYKHTPLVNDDGHFIDGTSIFILLDIHILDRAIKSILLKNILYIEMSFKTKMVHKMAKNLGVHTNCKVLGGNAPADYLL